MPGATLRAGRLFDKPRDFQFRVGVTFSVSSAPAVELIGTAYTRWTPDVLTVVNGFWLQVASSTLGGLVVTYSGPSAPSGGIIHTGAHGNHEAVLELTGVQIYGKLVSDGEEGWIQQWLVTWTGGSIQVDGVTRLTITGDSASSVQMLTPSSIPYFGIPWTVEGDGGVQQNNPDCSGNMTGTVNGGWRFREDGGAWQELPVSLLDPTVPAGTCDPSGLSAQATGIVAATTTWDGTIVVQESLTAGGAGENRGGWLCCLPNLKRAFKRFNPDFSAVLWRSGLPECWSRKRRLQSHIISPGHPSNCNYDNDNLTTVYDGLTEFLEEIGPIEGSGDIEDAFPATIYAPYRAFNIKGLIVLGPECVATPWPASSDTADFIFPYVVEDSLLNPYIATELNHFDGLVRYLNFWANAHWTFATYFPGSGAQEIWPLNDSAIEGQYYSDIRQQWAHHDELDTPSECRLINNSCQLMNGPWQPFFNGYRQGLPWAGISRFQVTEGECPASRDYNSDSESLWTFTNCTASFGTSIELTPDSGATTITARLDLGSFTVFPYMWAHICDRVRVDWNPSNIESVRVFFVSVTGERALLELVPGDGFTVANEEYEHPRVEDIYYVGSWTQDHGAGYISDTGVDALLTGISSATMSDPERCFAPGLLQGCTASYLEYEIDVIDDSVVELEYPTFLLSESPFRIFVETGQVQDLLVPRGPGLRFGNWDNYTPLGGFQNPPLVSVLPHKQSIVDALCTRNIITDARPHDDGVISELSSRYDFNEGQSASIVDQNSISFILPSGEDPTIRFALVHIMQECPPLACFPRKSRSLATWQETGDYSQYAYIWSVKTRYIVSSIVELHHFDKLSTQWTSSISGPEGWEVVSHEHPITNREVVGEFEIRSGTLSVARSRPWRGYFGLFGLKYEDSQDFLSYDVSREGRHALALFQKDTFKLGFAPNSPVPLEFELRDVELSDVTYAEIRWTKSANRLYIWVTRDGSVELYYTDNEGDSIEMATTIASSGEYGTGVIDYDNLKYCYWVDGTTIKGKILDNQDNVVESEFIAIPSGVDDRRIACDCSVGGTGHWRMILWYYSGGNLIQKSSEDGGVDVPFA